MLKKLLSTLATHQTNGKGALIYSPNEVLKYGGNGLIELELRLTPRRQEEFEKRLAALKMGRRHKLSESSTAFDAAVAAATKARAATSAAAEVEYQDSLRALFLEFNQPGVVTKAEPPPADEPLPRSEKPETPPVRPYPAPKKKPVAAVQPPSTPPTEMLVGTIPAPATPLAMGGEEVPA